jgi:hypothetical protein
MSSSQNNQSKRKNICDKEIQDFFFFMEDKLENNRKKIDQFIELIEQFTPQK